MKKVMMALVCLVLFNVSYADDSDCYNKLMNGSTDSAAHQVNISNLDTEDSMKSKTSVGLKELMKRCGCVPQFKKFQCGEAIKGNQLTDICYVETSWGYFIVSKDYLENLNIIFNRLD